MFAQPGVQSDDSTEFRPGHSGFVASGFGNLQGWIFHNLSGQPDPVLHYPHSKIFLT